MPSTRSKRPAPAPPSAATTRRTRPRTTVPTLTSLPYHILHQILLHTIPPPPFPPNSSHALLTLSRLHSNLTAPCLNILYHTPLLDPPSRAFDLLNLLRTRSDLAHLVRVLVIPVDPLLSRKTPVLGFFPFVEFLQLCSGLKEVWITQAADWPPYRTPTYAGTAKWSFTEDIMEAVSSRRLAAWNWDQMFLDVLGLEGVEKAHRSPAFQGLKRLRLSHFHASGKGNKNDDEAESAREAARIVGLLTGLKELEISHSPAVTDTFLSALGETEIRLTSLTLMNLTDSTLLGDGAITELLNSPLCQSLEELEILHCRATNLAFLEALPKTLTKLKYDGLYFSSSSITTVAAVPLYDELYPLLSGPGISVDDDDEDAQVPDLAWPPRLRSLTLLNLRKWNAKSADALLGSLMSSTNQDLGLGRQELHVILDGSSWRERAAFRDRWEEKLVRRFGGKGKGTVVVRVDAQRPGEVQFDEGSFLKGKSVLGPRSRPSRGRGRGRGSGARGAARGRRRVVVVRRDDDDDEEEDEDYEE